MSTSVKTVHDAFKLHVSICGFASWRTGVMQCLAPRLNMLCSIRDHTCWLLTYEFVKSPQCLLVNSYWFILGVCLFFLHFAVKGVRFLFHSLCVMSDQMSHFVYMTSTATWLLVDKYYKCKCPTWACFVLQKRGNVKLLWRLPPNTQHKVLST